MTDYNQTEPNVEEPYQTYVKRYDPRTEELKRALVSRINRACGQLNGVKNMLDEERCCEDILMQLSAIHKSVLSIANIMLDSHMRSCLRQRIEKGDESAFDEITMLFKRFQ